MLIAILRKGILMRPPEVDREHSDNSLSRINIALMRLREFFHSFVF